MLVLESFRKKGRYPLTEKLPESIKSSRFASHRARMSGKFDSSKVHNQQNLNEDHKYS